MHKGHDSPLPALTQLLPWLNVTDPRPSSAVGRSRSDLPDDRLHHAPHAPHAPHERSRSHGPPSTSRQPSRTDATRPPPKGGSLSARGQEVMRTAVASPRTPRFKLQQAPSHEGEHPPTEGAAPLAAPRVLPRRKGREPRLIRDSTNDWMLDHRLPGVMVCERAMPADPPSHEELRAPRAVSFGETAEDEAAAAQVARRFERIGCAAIADQALERHRRRRLSRMPVTPIDPEQVAEEHLCERYAEERMSEPTALRAWLRDKVDAAPGSHCTDETGWNHYINGVESDSAHLHALTQQRKRLSTMPGTDPRLRHALKSSGSHRASTAHDGGDVKPPLLPRPMSENLGVLVEDKRVLTCRHFKSPLTTCNEEASPLESPVVKQGALLTARKRRSTRQNPSSCRRSSCSESEEGAEEAEDDATDGEAGSPCTPRSSMANKQKRMEPQFFFSKVRLLQVVAAVPWLANEPTIKLVRLCRRAQHKVVSRYTAICREGGAGSHFYVLLEGSARMSSSLLKLDYELSKGECFGESVLMGDRCRRATVVALTQCSLLQFFMEDVERAQIDLTELSIRYRIQLLSSNSIFASFPEEKILRPLAMMTGVRDFQAGELIFSQGDHGDMLYILIEGRVSFHKTMKPRSTVVEHHGIIRKKRASMCVLRAGVRMSVMSNRAYGACGASGPTHEERDPAPAPKADVEFKVGECTPDCPRPMFGEISLWDRKPRQATARSVEPSKVLFLRHEHFQQFMNLLPDMEAMFAVGQAQYARWVYNSWSDSAGSGEGPRSVNSNAPILDTHPG